MMALLVETFSSFPIVAMVKLQNEKGRKFKVIKVEYLWFT